MLSDTIGRVRGIILAGEAGRHFYPITVSVGKQLLPVYDKPMIYYPLSTLISARIREILVMAPLEEVNQLRRLLGDGSQFGVYIDYVIWTTPFALGDAFTLGANFISKETVALILGDNLFDGSKIATQMQEFDGVDGGAVFAYAMADPYPYDVIEFDGSGRAIGFGKKSNRPKFQYVVPGIYIYDSSVVSVAQSLRPLTQGECGIRDINEYFLREGRLVVDFLPRGTTWLDMGTFKGFYDAASYVRAVMKHQGTTIGVPEEAAWRCGFIDDNRLAEHAERFVQSGYGAHLRELLEG